MNIPLVNLTRNYELYKKDYEAILIKVASSCSYILGQFVQEFELSLAEFLGVKHVIGVGSGTDALTLSLKALQLSPNSIVLTQTNSFIATSLAIEAAGHRVVLCDVSEETGEMDIDSYMGPKPDVVIPVHLYGYPKDISKINKRWKDVLIIEDACQAHGSKLKGRFCGTLGNAGAFSFYPGKNLGAFGDGGAVVTNDGSIAEEIKMLRNWGGTQKYVHNRIGGNSRLDAIQAAVLNYKLKHLSSWNERRNELSERYTENLKNSKLITPPSVKKEDYSAQHLYVTLASEDNRDNFQNFFAKNNIGTGIHYPICIHKQLVYSNTEISKYNLPMAEKRAKSMISLPLCPLLSNDECDQVCEIVHKL